MSIYESHPRFEPSELYRAVLGLAALGPNDGNISASRKQMFASHIGQALVFAEPTPRRQQTGMENEYGKRTFSVKMPCRAQIIRLIQRYPRTMDENSIASCPEILVIYENLENGSIGCLSLPEFYSHHQHFGFRYRRTEAFNLLFKGSEIPKDTVFLESPNVTAEGHYCYGREANIALMTHPATSEDGVGIRRGFLKKLAIKTYETRVVEWGAKQYPINLYGTATKVKPFPDIGERIAEHGMVMAFRTYDDGFAPVEQSISTMRRVDSIFDNAVYAGAGGRVIDIQVMHDEHSLPPTTLTGLDEQALKYDRARHQYYDAIRVEYERLHRERGDSLSLSPEFHRLVVETLGVTAASRKPERNQTPERVSKEYRGVPLDDWRVQFTIEYEIIPNIGFKLTDCQGDKGVICAIIEDDDMPVDSAGNVADIIMDPGATTNRMTPGRLYELFVNASGRDLTKELRRLLDYPESHANHRVKPKPDVIRAHPNFDRAWQRLIRFYEITSPSIHEILTNKNGKSRYRLSLQNHMCRVLENGIYINQPPDAPVYRPEMGRLLQREYPSTYGPVTYRGFSGNRVTTKNPVRISSGYIMLLEKTGDDWTAVSSGKLQNFGVLGQVNNRDKYATPTKTQSIRAWGETEMRIVLAYAGRVAAGEVLDRNNSIHTHEQMLEAIYLAENPSNIETAVDRKTNPRGNPRPLQLFKHIAFCGGWALEYAPYRPGEMPDLESLDKEDILNGLSEPEDSEDE